MRETPFRNPKNGKTTLPGAAQIPLRTPDSKQKSPLLLETQRFQTDRRLFLSKSARSRILHSSFRQIVITLMTLDIELADLLSEPASRKEIRIP